MSSSTSDDSGLIKILTLVSTQLNRYVSLFIFIIGIVGNILNILVLSKRKFRLNPCAFLFLISSISNLISIGFGLSSRIMSSWNVDFTETNRFLCKLRTCIMFTSRTIGFWLISLAGIDRWILSLRNPRHRRLNSLRNVRCCTLLIVITSILVYSHVIHCYEANLLETPLKCYGKTPSCRLLTDIIYTVFTIMLPILCMIISGIMMISNVRRTHRFVLVRGIIFVRFQNKFISVYGKTRKQYWKKIDRYLCRMLFLQVVLLVCLTLPQTIHKLYFTLTFNKYKTELRFAIDRLLYSFDSLLPYLESGMPFYIYTLTGGKVFRNVVKRLLLCNK